MNRLIKYRLYGGLALALVSLVLEWLIKTESSPLYHYFLYHVDIPNTWVAINFMCNVFAILVSPIAKALSISDSTGYYIALFLQWYLMGWLVTAVICRVTARSNFRNSKKTV
jgi:hypothetical protein